MRVWSLNNSNMVTMAIRWLLLLYIHSIFVMFPKLPCSSNLVGNYNEKNVIFLDVSKTILVLKNDHPFVYI